jgi:rRNA maturation protein Nop10
MNSTKTTAGEVPALCADCDGYGSIRDRGIMERCSRCGGTGLGPVPCATSPRERWKFVRRETAQTFGGAPNVDYYVWHLLDERGRINSAWVAPVAQLLGGKL